MRIVSNLCFQKAVILQRFSDGMMPTGKGFPNDKRLS